MKRRCRIGGLVAAALAVGMLGVAGLAGAQVSWSDSDACTTCHTDKVVAAGGDSAEPAEVAAAKPADARTDAAKTGSADVSESKAPATVQEDTAELASVSDDTGSACVSLAQIHDSLGCVSCHEVTDSLERKHKDVVEGDRLPRRLSSKNAVKGDVCRACHADAEALAQATADLTVLTDEQGTTVNPHAMPANHDDSMVSCVDCHTVHEAASPLETAPAFCTTCHHANVYECNTCHA